MDAHFWPSMYPTIIVGMMIGLGYGSISNVIVGGLSGLVVGAAGFFALEALGMSIPLGTIFFSAVGAFLVINVIKAIRTQLNRAPDKAS